MNKLDIGPVIPIPPAYSFRGSLNLDEIKGYLDFLSEQGVRTVMTTAGTSQYNLLSIDEIFELNRHIDENWNGNFIFGMPTLPNTALLEEFSRYASFKGPNRIPMFLYPERYYDDESVVDFFRHIGDSWGEGIFIHAMFMRRGTGGTYDFTSKLINKIADTTKLLGIKEETSELSQAYSTVSDLKDMIVIVAGGSMRRFMFLKPAGADTFLSGVGSFAPRIEIEFLEYMKEGNLNSATDLINNYEDELFKYFMKVGWHRALREGLEVKGLMYAGNRAPFSRLSESERLGVFGHVQGLI